MKQKSSILLLVFRILFTCCLAGTVVFIFANSAEIGEISGGKSEAVMILLNKVLIKLGMSFQLTQYQVRKLAHLSEFALLGFWLMLTLRVYTRKLLSHISWPLLGGLSVAVLDEAFQLLIPGRAGQVQDILIDFCGVLAGLCCGLFLLLLFRAFWEELQG